MRWFGLLVVALALEALPAAADDVASTYLRTAIFVKDREATVKFFTDVMGYTVVSTNDLAPAGEMDPLGFPPGTTRTLTGLKSANGAGLSIMEVRHPDLAALARPPDGANRWGDVMLVHEVKNIEGIEARARAGGYEVIRPARPSASGKSLQMFLRDPNGVRLELYEMRPAQK
jgi:catechol 2,3-dioxygenase-like lactoylglutathione lyase family enzyme